MDLTYRNSDVSDAEVLIDIYNLWKLFQKKTISELGLTKNFAVTL